MLSNEIYLEYSNFSVTRIEISFGVRGGDLAEQTKFPAQVNNKWIQFIIIMFNVHNKVSEHSIPFVRSTQGSNDGGSFGW